MSEKPPEFLASNEKAGGFFVEHGELTENEKRLSKIVNAYAENKRFNIDDFRKEPRFGEQTVLEDGRRIRAKAAKIADEQEHLRATDPARLGDIERGSLSEQATIYGISEGRWLGKSAKIKVASVFDDYFNGTDFVAELDDSKQLAIGIDTTISAGEIPNKLKRVRDNILDGKLSEVKYYKSERFVGSLKNIPLTIIGASAERNASLAETIYNLETIDEYNSPEAKRAAQEKLEKHIAQLTHLLEIEIELKAYLKLAEQSGYTEIASPLRADLQKIRELIRSKLPIKESARKEILALARADEIYRSIKEALEINFTNWEEPNIVVAKIPKDEPPKTSLTPSWKR